MNELRV